MQAPEGAASDFFEDDEEDFGLGGPAADLEGTGVSANDDAASIDLYGDIADGGRDDYASLYGETPSTHQAQGGVQQQTVDTGDPPKNGKAEHSLDSGAPKQQSSADPGHAAKRTSAPESTRAEPSYGTTDSIYIGNLQWWTTDAQIEELCSKYGAPQKIRFFEDKASGKSKGYVLVTFDTVKAAYTCKQELDGTMVDGKKCVVTFAKQKEPGKGVPAQRDGSATASTSQGPSGRGTAFRGRGQEHAGRAGRPRPMGDPPFPGGMGGGRGPGRGWSGGPGMGGPFMPPGMMGPGMGPGMGPMGPGMPFMPPGFPPGMQPGMHMGGGMQYGRGPMNNFKRPRY